jgi:hypothetical protein
VPESPKSVDSARLALVTGNLGNRVSVVITLHVKGAYDQP